MYPYGYYRGGAPYGESRFFAFPFLGGLAGGLLGGLAAGALIGRPGFYGAPFPYYPPYPAIPYGGYGAYGAPYGSPAAIYNTYYTAPPLYR
ncbi:hypothetical protein ACFOU2_12670 [Bacillus songklensis]|uniref:Spore coat protein n=1 Tax=Bacillus songklensis TaxID=1069116 RepID=A0ABV8B3R8_9BACI